MNSIRRALSIPIASSGVNYFERENYEKCVARLEQAFDWGPDVLKGTIFEGYFGLALAKTNRQDQARIHLASAKKGLSESPSEDPETATTELRVLKRIEAVLNEHDT